MEKLGTIIAVDVERRRLLATDLPGGMPRQVDPNARVYFNGLRATLADLRRGDAIQVDGNPAVTVRATRPID